MKKHQLLLAVLAFSFAATAQPPRKRQVMDSSYYYSSEMSKIIRQAHDSARNTEAYKELQKKYNGYISQSDGYNSFNLFTEVVAADYAVFNKEITAAGFPAMKGPLIRFGVGTTIKGDRFIFDFNYFSLSIGKKVKKGDEEIRTFMSNGIICDLGYDLVKSQKVNIYPYGGLSMRVASIYYTKPVTGNPNATNITNLVLNNQSVTADYTRLGLQAGVGFDFVISKPGKAERYNQNNGTMLFIKAGTSQMIGKERYKTEVGKYTPGIKYGSWAVALGVKFFGR